MDYTKHEAMLLSYTRKRHSAYLWLVLGIIEHLRLGHSEPVHPEGLGLNTSLVNCKPIMTMIHTPPTSKLAKLIWIKSTGLHRDFFRWRDRLRWWAEPCRTCGGIFFIILFVDVSRGHFFPTFYPFARFNCNKNLRICRNDPTKR